MRHDEMKILHTVRNSTLIEISIPSSLYSSASDSMLRRFGFTTSGSGGGRYEYQIEGKKKEQVRDILSKIWVSLAGIEIYSL